MVGAAERLRRHVSGRYFAGKTIVMGNSRSGMSKMIEQVPNSTLLVSQHSRQYNAGMDVVRNAIVEHGVLPENNDVLFATTTMREGVTLRPESGVRNVVTFLPTRCMCRSSWGAAGSTWRTWWWSMTRAH